LQNIRKKQAISVFFRLFDDYNFFYQLIYVDKDGKWRVLLEETEELLQLEKTLHKHDLHLIVVIEEDQCSVYHYA